jgi:hypothetical protein
VHLAYSGLKHLLHENNKFKVLLDELFLGQATRHKEYRIPQENSYRESSPSQPFPSFSSWEKSSTYRLGGYGIPTPDYICIHPRRLSDNFGYILNSVNHNFLVNSFLPLSVLTLRLLGTISVRINGFQFWDLKNLKEINYIHPT